MLESMVPSNHQTFSQTWLAGAFTLITFPYVNAHLEGISMCIRYFALQCFINRGMVVYPDQNPDQIPLSPKKSHWKSYQIRSCRWLPAPMTPSLDHPWLHPVSSNGCDRRGSQPPPPVRPWWGVPAIMGLHGNGISLITTKKAYLWTKMHVDIVGYAGDVYMYICIYIYI